MFRAALLTSLVLSILTVPTASSAAEGRVDVVREASAPTAKSPARTKFKRGAEATLSAREVNEGDRLTVRVKVTSPKKARRVNLERWDVPLYYGTPAWKKVASVKARGRARVNFSRVAVGPDSERYRVQVTYKKRAKPVRSAPVQAKVWRWIGLRSFSAYYETVGTAFIHQALNGRTYQAWGGYFGYYRSWEAKFTPGRNCKAFRGIVALADHSYDDSTGAIVLSADDQVLYQSPELTPGMQATMYVPMATPYRIWLQALNTSEEGVRSYPNIGDPAMLCNYA